MFNVLYEKNKLNAPEMDYPTQIHVELKAFQANFQRPVRASTFVLTFASSSF